MLEGELDRALIVGAGQSLPSDVVTLDSRVLVVDLESGEERLFTVVLPAKANVDEGRISVLAPLGMAVRGYRSGDEIALRDLIVEVTGVREAILDHALTRRRAGGARAYSAGGAS
jgi:transcription elongation GreA/GreB family factor